MSGYFRSQPFLRHLLRVFSVLFVVAGPGLALLSASPASAAEAYAGRPVSEVLQEWQGRGLTLIYNDHLLPS